MAELQNRYSGPLFDNPEINRLMSNAGEAIDGINAVAYNIGGPKRAQALLVVGATDAVVKALTGLTLQLEQIAELIADQNRNTP